MDDAELAENGTHVGRKRIERLMRSEPLERHRSERQWRTISLVSAVESSLRRRSKTNVYGLLLI